MQVPRALFQSLHYTNPLSLIIKLMVHYSGRIQRLPCVPGAELQQSLHAAGVLLYVHGGSISGAGQDVQNFILSFQLCLSLQGEVLQLHQHLQKHTYTQSNTYTLVFFG